jgi:hypothetical protein
MQPGHIQFITSGVSPSGKPTTPEFKSNETSKPMPQNSAIVIKISPSDDSVDAPFGNGFEIAVTVLSLACVKDGIDLSRSSQTTSANPERKRMIRMMRLNARSLTLRNIRIPSAVPAASAGRLTRKSTSTFDDSS